MPVELTITAPTLAEVIAAEPDLRWSRLETADGEPLDAQALAGLSADQLLAARRRIPRSPGVYVWSVATESQIESERAVIYIGSARGRAGLFGRMDGQLHGIHHQRARRRSERWRQRYYSSHPRVVLDLDARLHYGSAPADGSELDGECIDPLMVESSLVQFCRFATGSKPLLNGSAWRNRGDLQDRAEARAWAAIRRTGRLLHPGGPGDGDDEALADPPQRG